MAEYLATVTYSGEHSSLDKTIEFFLSKLNNCFSLANSDVDDTVFARMIVAEINFQEWIKY